MGRRVRKKKGSRRSEREGRRQGTSARAVWVWTIVGLAMAAGGGVAFGNAWGKGYLISWWVGGLSVLAGILMVLSAIRASSAAAKEAKEAALKWEYPREFPDEREPLVPLLGALLVYKYRALTQEQLNRALEQQLGQDRGKHRLGEILLEMGMVTESQLAEALEHQRLYVRGRQEMALETVGSREGGLEDRSGGADYGAV